MRSVTGRTPGFCHGRAVLIAMAAVTAMLLGAQRSEAVDVPLDPRGTFLRTNSDPNAAPPLILNFAGQGVGPGTLLRIRALGDYRSAPSFGDDRRRVVCVFSSSGTLLASDQIARVPGAIDASTAVFTSATFIGDLPTDIPEDFFCADVIVPVPAGATHLFVGVTDSFYGDNDDPDGNFRVRVELPGPVPTAFQAFDRSKWSSGSEVRVQELNGRRALLGAAGGPGGVPQGAQALGASARLPFANQAGVQSIEATVTVLDGHAIGSAFSIPPSASIDAFFYRDDTGTGTDGTGHVQGSISLSLTQGLNHPTASYFVLKCVDAACSTQIALTAGTLSEAIEFSESHRLRIAFDAGSGNFTFQLDGAPPVIFTTPDAVRRPITVPFAQVRARAGTIPADPNASASLLAFFDDVVLNGVPHDSFETQTLPRVQILPGSGTFPPNQQVDVVILVETGGEAIDASNVRFLFNNQDFSGFLPTAIAGTPTGGGRSFRFPGIVLGNFIPPGTAVLVGAEVTTPSGAKGAGSAFWRVIP